MSRLGNAIAPLALAFAVLDLTGSVTDLSYVTAARSVPNVVLVLLGGALADRTQQRRILMWSAAIAGVSQGICAVSLATGTASIGLLMLLGAINGASAALAGPASGVLFRQAVPDDQLRDANVASRLGMHLGLVTGLGGSGLIVAATSPAVGVGIDAMTFFLAAIAYGRLRLPARPTAAGRSMLADLRAGAGVVRSRSWLTACLLLTFVTGLVFAAGLQVLGPVVADATFGRGGLGIAAAAQTIGPITGAVVATRIPDVLRLRSALLLSGTVAFPVTVLAAGGRIPDRLLLIAFIGAMFIAGLAMELASVWEDLAIQRHVELDQLGRVGSYSAIASIGGLPSGEILAGPLTGFFHVTGALLVLAMLAVVATLLAAHLREVRELDQPEPR